MSETDCHLELKAGYIISLARNKTQSNTPSSLNPLPGFLFVWVVDVDLLHYQYYCFLFAITIHQFTIVLWSKQNYPIRYKQLQPLHYLKQLKF